jgi:general secretion pathway protein F
MSTHGITLDQLVDLNAEIAALARAGVPMGPALRDLGRDLPGRLGSITKELGRRLEKGDTLADVVARSDDLLPPVYRAVVMAGIRSGRLPVALEGLSTAARRFSELHRLVGVSLLYPLLVLGFAYCLFVWTTVVWAPSVVDGFREFGGKATWLGALVAVGNAAKWWAPWLPVAFLVLLFFGWRRSGSCATGYGVAGRLLGIARVLRTTSLATFADVLRLLVEQDVTLDEAVVLAADASGDPRLAKAAREMADRIQRGEKGSGEPVSAGGFPPMLAWLIETCRRPSQLAGTLRMYADSYHAEALRAGQWATVYLPILLAAGVGGCTVALLAVGTLGPWFELLYEMAIKN